MSEFGRVPRHEDGTIIGVVVNDGRGKHAPSVLVDVPNRRLVVTRASCRTLGVAQDVSNDSCTVRRGSITRQTNEKAGRRATKE